MFVCSEYALKLLDSGKDIEICVVLAKKRTESKATTGISKKEKARLQFDLSTSLYSYIHNRYHVPHSTKNNNLQILDPEYFVLKITEAQAEYRLSRNNEHREISRT